jgi:hypothetical protein
MSTTPLLIGRLQDLADKDFDLAALTMIQHQAIAQAIEARALKGESTSNRPAIVGEADRLLPQGDNLHRLYMETFIALRNKPLDDLEAVSNSLSLAAHHLERIAAKSMTKNVTLAQHAVIEQSIGERLAQLIDGARTLSQIGVTSVQHSDRLAKLTDCPVGPLGYFFDKAESILAHKDAQEEQPVRMRMAA